MRLVYRNEIVFSVLVDPHCIWTAAMRYSINGENNLCRTFEIISFVQQEKIRAELRNLQLRAIAHDLHFYFC